MKTLAETLETIAENALFDTQGLQIASKLTWFEKIVLKFIKKQYFTDKLKSSTIIYKTWKRKLYIIEHFYVLPMHFMCRCVIEKRINDCSIEL